MRITVPQIDPVGLALFVQNTQSGAWSGNMAVYISNGGTFGGLVPYLGQNQTFSGVNTFSFPIFVPYTGGTGTAINRQAVLDLLTGSLISVSGGLTGNMVSVGGNQSIGGYKIFTGNLGVGNPLGTGDAANVAYVLYVSGQLAGGAGIPNLMFLTGDQTVNGIKTFNTSPFVANPTTSGQAVNLGNLTTTSGLLQTLISGSSGTNNSRTNTDISFFFDQYNLSTGLNLIEGFVSQSFIFTGYALGTINSGTQGFISGSAYQRTPTNVKSAFANFILSSGSFYFVSGPFSSPITGQNRIGIDINFIGSGFTGFSVGLFGI